jgi:hypothetical protein
MLNIKHLTLGAIAQCTEHCHHKCVPTPPHHFEWELKRPLAKGSTSPHLHCAKLHEMNITCRQEKLTQSCLCNSPFDFRGRSLALIWWIQKPFHLLSEISLMYMSNLEWIYQLQQPFVKDHQTSSHYAITIHPYRRMCTSSFAFTNSSNILPWRLVFALSMSPMHCHIVLFKSLL